ERQDLKVDWESLQRPGFSPDYLDQQCERMDLAFQRSDWIPTAAARALLRNNRPLLAYISGKAAHFTSKDHVFFPGETVEKQLIVINNSRQNVTGEGTWSFDLPQASAGHQQIAVAPAQQERVPLRFALPEPVAPGQYELNASVRFSSGETQTDSFAVHIVPRPSASPINGRIALFDPHGETDELLSRTGIRCQRIDATTDLAPFDTLIVGKAALTPQGAAPLIARVRDGLKVLIFEQSSEV